MGCGIQFPVDYVSPSSATSDDDDDDDVDDDVDDDDLHRSDGDQGALVRHQEMHDPLLPISTLPIRYPKPSPPL